MSTNPQVARGEFVRAFNGIARHRHRYEVFRDFVNLSALSIHNAMRDFLPSERFETLEAEYLAIVKRYEKDDVDAFAQLLAKLVVMLEPEPRDVLGPLYMELELGNSGTGQFFSPPEIAELMARVTYGEDLARLERPFITLCEPACGAGGMILAFVKVMLSHKHNPAQRVWVQAQDIDRLAALMCYLQMALWHVPGVVVVGNTLAMEVQETFYTPAHYLGCWGPRLNRHWAEQAPAPSPLASATAEIPETAPRTPEVATPMARVQGQFGFDF